MQRRIYGIETEYGIIFTPEGRKTLTVEKAICFLFEKLVTTKHFLNYSSRTARASTRIRAATPSTRRPSAHHRAR